MGNFFETNNKNNIIEQQQKLNEIFNLEQINQITKYNLLCFNPKIIFEYYRQTKSYLDQLTSMDKEQLLSSEHNELYIGQLGINIENNGGNVIFIKPEDLKRKYVIMSFNYKSHDEYIFKHCEYEIIEDNINTDNTNIDNTNTDNTNTDNLDIELMKESINKIKEYEEKIKELNTMIAEEKDKIKNTNYVKSRINKNMSDIDKYINDVNKYCDEFNKTRNY